MTIVNGYLDWAERRDGPANKVYSQTNSNLGIVLHSVEGWLPGAFGELDKPDRQASWHFTNSLEGTLYQHYPITASCWASGNFNANTMYVAMESEGMAGTPLNALQVATALRLVRELGFTEKGVTVFDHNEVATKWSPNSGPTACPSGRYQPLYAALEDEVTKEQLEDLWLAIASGQEEASLDRATRVANAGYRIGQIVAGERPSMLEVAYATKGQLEAKPWLEDIATRVRTIPGLAGDQ